MAISRKQKQILSFPYTKYDALIADGAIRSGKTSFMVVAFIDDAMRRYEKQRFGICGKTVDSTVKNIIMPYLSMTLPREKYSVEWKRSDKTLLVSNGEVENIFEVFGGKDESSFTLIQGRTLAGVLLDEVALQPRSFVEQALARCSVEGSKLWFNCNPDRPSHWFYKEWVTQPEKHNAIRLQFRLTDNPSLSDAIIQRYENMYSGVFYSRYIKGLWVAAEGAIYPQFIENKERFLIDKPPSIARAAIGVDFGGTGSAHSFSLTGFTPGMKEVVLLDENYHNNKKQGVWSPDQLNKAFVDFVLKAKANGLRVYEAYCDSAEQTLIQGLRIAAAKAGLGVEIKNAKKGPINDRIAFYNSLMAQDRFKIMRHCKNTIAALESAVYNGKNSVEDERLDDGTTNIDSLDSMEYSTESVQDEILYLGIRR